MHSRTEELGQCLVELCPCRHVPRVTAAERQYRCKLNLILRIHQYQIFRVQNPNNIRAHPAIHRNPRVTRAVHLEHEAEREPLLHVQHVALVQARHHVTHPFILILQRRNQEEMIRGIQPGLLRHVHIRGVQFNQPLHLVHAVHVPNVPSQKVVQDQGQWVRHWEEKNPEKLHQPYRVRPNEQRVPAADGLWRDLAENQHGRHRDDQSQKLRGHTREQDGEPVVHDRVPEQQRAEQQVAVCANGDDLVRILFLVLVARRREHPQCNHIETQEAQCETRKERGEAYQHDDQWDGRRQREQAIRRRRLVGAFEA
mmetsp:Transcript_13017/g.37539  ORF Transcript_13017/g.37539 Transcript_13017/m.37539 type:complete len:312 (-) Transcript_13017:224-1159(-)